MPTRGASRPPGLTPSRAAEDRVENAADQPAAETRRGRPGGALGERFDNRVAPPAGGLLLRLRGLHLGPSALEPGPLRLGRRLDRLRLRLGPALQHLVRRLAV